MQQSEGRGTKYKGDHALSSSNVAEHKYNAVTIGTAAVRGNLGAIHTAPLKRMLNATRERIILK